MEDLGILCIFPHDFKYYVWFLWLRDFYSIMFLVIEIDPIFIMCFAHFTSERSPFDTYTELGFHYVQPFSKPGPEALQMDISNRTRTFARTNQWIGVLSWLKADPASHLALSHN